jgi:anti-anti-sigma regulatory factor
MSCRIDRALGGDGVVVLNISGRITEQDVDTLRAVIQVEASAVAIDLDQVDLIDREAVKFLAQKELSGTVLRNCSAYIREWVTKERTEMMEKSGDTGDA